MIILDTDILTAIKSRNEVDSEKLAKIRIEVRQNMILIPWYLSEIDL